MITNNRSTYKRVWLDDEHTTCRHEKTGEIHYKVELVNDELIRVTRDDDAKTVLVRQDSDFVWQLKKTYIKARYCAKGIYEHLEHCFRKDGELWNAADFYTFCDWVIDEMRPAPKRPELGMNYERLEDAAYYATCMKGESVEVGDKWMVAVWKHFGTWCAWLNHYEGGRVRYRCETEAAMTPKQAAKWAAETLWNDYANGQAAA